MQDVKLQNKHFAHQTFLSLGRSSERDFPVIANSTNFIRMKVLVFMLN